MARAASGKGRGKKTRNKKRKVKVSQYDTGPHGLGPYGSRRKPQAGAGTASGVVASTAAAAGSAAGTGAAEAQSVTEAGDTAAFTGSVSSPQQQSASSSLAGESSLAVDATVVSAHDRMLARAAELEATIAKLLPLLPSTPGIGHNNPPPLDRLELEEIKADIALLKTQPPPTSAEATGIASKFADRAKGVLAWASAIILAEAAKPIAKDAVEWLWLKIGTQLTDAATAIMQWVLTLLG